MLDQCLSNLELSKVPYPKTSGGQRPSRYLAMAGFFAPFVLAVAGWLATSSDGLAQATDPLQMLQQVQRGGLGGLGALSGGVQDLTTNQPQSQTLQPQTPLRAFRLPTSRLEQILSARAGMRLQQFGYDQLGGGRPVTVPETGAVQDDYILGPGDEIIVSLRGQENSDVRVSVDRNGRVLLPRLSPIPAAGRNFGSFRADVDALVRRAYVASTASIAIARVRQINVLVSGEVTVPGQRLVTGLSSAVDAILLSGGIKKSGSLRNIRIQRAGRDLTVDFYSVLTGGGVGSNMRLADGDRIIVPPLGPVVAVAGLVRRPGIYELPAGAKSLTARALLSLAGGHEVRGRYRLSVQRIEADGRLNLIPLSSETNVVRDSEILRVELGADLASAQATLSGGTGLAGQYAISSGTKLSEIMRAPGALGQNPYTLFGLIVRKDPRTLLRSLIAFTPVAVINGTEDMQLQSDDIVRPITVGESQMLSYVVKTYLDKLAYDQSRIRNPLEASRRDANAAVTTTTTTASGNVPGASTTVATTPQVSPNNPFGLQPEQLTAYSSDQEDFSGVPADMLRANITALLDVATPGTPLAQQREAAYQKALTASTMGPNAGMQTPAQLAQAQQSALLAAQSGAGQNGFSAATAPQAGFGQDMGGQSLSGQNGAADLTGGNGFNGNNGFNDISGSQPAVPLAPNFQDQPAGPGAYASNQEVRTFGELSRQLGTDPLVLINFFIDHRARLDGAVRGPGPYFVGPNVSLADLVQAAGGTASWADESGVELLTTAVDGRSGRAVSQRQTLPLRQNTLVSYIVRPRDQLHFNQVFTDVGVGSVTVQGEVRFGGKYPIKRGDRLSDVLMRVGGLTSTAYPAGTVFLRRTAAQIEQDGYNRAANDIQSQLLAGMARVGNDKIPVEAFTAMQSFVTQLRTQKALGRIAITADPSVLAANPSLDPLLEAGDVIFIPQRPATIAVLGEVMQPGSYAYRAGMTVGDYVRRAGGYAQFSDEDMTFIVQPDGSARRIETSWLNFDSTPLPPGSAIVIPRDLAPLNARQIVLDVTGIMSSLAVTIASLAVLARQ